MGTHKLTYGPRPGHGLEPQATIRPAMSSWRWAFFGLLLLTSVSLPRTTVGDEPVRGEPVARDPAGRVAPFDPAGHLFLVGGGTLTDDLRREFARLGGADRPDSRLVIVPTASAAADDPQEDWRQPWQDLGFARIDVLHTRQRTQADQEAFVEPLRQATAIWLTGGDQSRLAEAYAGTAVESALRERLLAGAVVGGTSAGAAIASRVMIAGGREQPELATGFDLLPGAILDQHFSQRQRQNRLQAAVARHPACVGLGLDESTAVIVHQRSLRVLGTGRAHLYFAATPHQPARQWELRPGQRNLDWTTLARTNRERHLPPFPATANVAAEPADGQPPGQPPATPPIDAAQVAELTAGTAAQSTPLVPHGSLLIVGGGGATPDIWQAFVDQAGGAEARIVILPTAVPASELNRAGGQPGEARVFRRLGVRDVQVLPQTDWETVNADSFRETLANATGIWFGGGRQWRFVDAYEDSQALVGMHACLQRGGIIGGSSAGASIQGELLIRGAPVGNQIMVQDGYRRGFGFLPGFGIDQHFAQRGRFQDLEDTLQKFPTMVGLGIDESTAVLVQQNQAQVLGRGSVYLYSKAHWPADANNRPASDRPLRRDSGQTFDLRTLDLIKAGD